jgi:hypothetical protein
MQLTLNTKQIYVTQQQPQTPPALPIQFAKPLSYEFRVAEHLDANNNVERVGLQVQIHEHDEYGSGSIRVGWIDVPRVKLKDGVIWTPPDLGTTP